MDKDKRIAELERELARVTAERDAASASRDDLALKAWEAATGGDAAKASLARAAALEQLTPNVTLTRVLHEAVHELQQRISRDARDVLPEPMGGHRVPVTGEDSGVRITFERDAGLNGIRVVLDTTKTIRANLRIGMIDAERAGILTMLNEQERARKVAGPGVTGTNPTFVGVDMTDMEKRVAQYMKDYVDPETWSAALRKGKKL